EPSGRRGAAVGRRISVTARAVQGRQPGGGFGGVRRDRLGADPGAGGDGAGGRWASAPAGAQHGRRYATAGRHASHSADAAGLRVLQLDRPDGAEGPAACGEPNAATGTATAAAATGAAQGVR